MFSFRRQTVPKNAPRQRGPLIPGNSVRSLALWLRAAGVAAVWLGAAPWSARPAWAQSGATSHPDYIVGYFIFFLLVAFGLVAICKPTNRPFEVKKDNY